FPIKERSTAMGIINAGTGVGGVVAPWVITGVVTYFNFFHLSSWRWVFFLTGTAGLLWTLWWITDYEVPENHPPLTSDEREIIVQSQANPIARSSDVIPLSHLLSFVETWGVVISKFLTDGAWYFYMFWLPKYLYDARGFDIKGVGMVAWIPFAAAGIG